MCEPRAGRTHRGEIRTESYPCNELLSLARSQGGEGRPTHEEETAKAERARVSAVAEGRIWNSTHATKRHTKRVKPPYFSCGIAEWRGRGRERGAV